MRNDRKNQYSHPPDRRSLKAFTLIEVLIVVATISLLLAILLPGLRGARNYANEVICQANLNQISKAWQMYLNAYDGAFYQKMNANLNYGGWRGEVDDYPRPLNPYLALPVDLGSDLPDIPVWDASETLQVEKDAGIFRCPKDNGNVPSTSLLCFEKFGTSYQTNLLLIGQNQVLITGSGRLAPLYDGINARLKRMNVSRAYDPTHLILIGDYGWVNQWKPMATAKTEWHNRPAYHNVAFLDGHVEMMKIRQGLFVTPSYRVLPFEDLDELACRLQQEEP
jgi:prepilin-type processing-associated H-X9-DG protein